LRFNTSRPSHPAPNVRDDREPPLLWVRDGDKEAIDLGLVQSEYFSRANWTTQIRLNQLKKSSFTRTSFSAEQVVSAIVRHSEVDLICPSGRRGDRRYARALDSSPSLSFTVFRTI
jgi:hypothetical protein